MVLSEKVGDGATGLADTCGLHEQGTLDGAGVAGKIGFNVGLFVGLFDLVILGLRVGLGLLGFRVGFGTGLNVGFRVGFFTGTFVGVLTASVTWHNICINASRINHELKAHRDDLCDFMVIRRQVIK